MASLSEIKAQHPVKSEINKDRVAVFYMKFGEYWFGVGLSHDAVEWQWQNMVRN